MKLNNGRIKRFFSIVLMGFRFSPVLFLLKLFSVILVALTTFINLLSTKILLNSLEGQHLKQFLIAVLILASSNFLFSSINTLFSPVMAKLGESMNAKIIDDFLKKSTRIGLGDFESKGFYDKYTLVFDKCCTVFQSAIGCFFSIISALLHIIITIVILSWMEAFCLGILLLFAIIQTLIGNYVKKVNYWYQKETAKSRKKLNYIYRLFYIPEFMRDIRANDIWDFVFEKKTMESQRIIEETYKSQCTIRGKKYLQLFVSLAESIFITSYLGYKVISGEIWLDMFVVSQSSYSQLKNAIVGLLSTFNSIYENDLFASDYIELMNANEVYSIAHLPISSACIEKIEFCDVSFSYPNSSSDALQNVSFSIRKGEKIFIAGCNGSGKTTIVKLLLRLYDPTHGVILINDRDIRLYEISALRQAFSVMFQDYAVYAFSIYENMCLARNIPKEEVENMLQTLGLLNTVHRLEKGVNTPLSCQLDDDGIELSGGEKQRLAIGRTLLKRASVVVLDEPTSNLDASIVPKLTPILLSNSSLTLILISHQLSFAQHASRVLYFEAGKLLEEGTHDELIKLSEGAYAQFHARFKGKKIMYEKH